MLIRKKKFIYLAFRAGLTRTEPRLDLHYELRTFCVE